MNEQETTKEEGADPPPEQIEKIIKDGYYIRVGTEYYGAEPKLSQVQTSSNMHGTEGSM